ncbi:MAG: hypothetical protein KDJ65_22065 [Anaerolineae bacterium]|nr:hypothetical protein [Anaerolineae bacterium]
MTMTLFLQVFTGQGIRLQGEIAMDELPDDLARQAQAILQDDRMLADAASAQPPPQMVDVSTYELTLYYDASHTHYKHYTFVDAETNIDVLDLLDDIMHEIIRHKKGLV